MRTGLVVILSLSASLAWADSSPRRVVLQRGRSESIRVEHPVLLAQCDDPSIVKVKTSGFDVRFTGLKPGHTSCGLWGNPKAGIHTIVEVRVQGVATDGGS